jgi:hypothetical protein
VGERGDDHADLPLVLRNRFQASTAVKESDDGYSARGFVVAVRVVSQVWVSGWPFGARSAGDRTAGVSEPDSPAALRRREP